MGGQEAREPGPQSKSLTVVIHSWWGRRVDKKFSDYWNSISAIIGIVEVIVQ